jgi:hypothetical protein
MGRRSRLAFGIMLRRRSDVSSIDALFLHLLLLWVGVRRSHCILLYLGAGLEVGSIIVVGHLIF